MAIVENTFMAVICRAKWDAGRDPAGCAQAIPRHFRRVREHQTRPVLRHRQHFVGVFVEV